jgi:choline-sulfatase
MGSQPPAGPAHALRARWRYRFVVALIWVAVLAAAVAGWRYARASGPAFGPIIVISLESVRADHLPVYGYARIRTPALDALAADAVAFDRAYAHSPLTLPSHVSMLSGLLPFQTGVRDEIGFPIRQEVSLLPQLLHRRGFKTGGVVSNVLLRKDTGLGPAFGFFDDEHTGKDAAEAVKVAEQWIDTIGTGRFFLFLHLDVGPPAAGAPALTASMPRVSDYDKRIVQADELLAGFIAFLKKRGLYNGGVLIVTSDHGESLGDHGEQRHGLFLYESAVRVPLIVKMPRRDGGGRHSAALVQHLDITPTVLDLVGAPRPSGLGGRSLRNVLDSPTAVIPSRRVYAETLAPRYRFGWSEVQSLTDDRRRYIKTARPELYDVLQDPRERTDLVETDAAAAEELRLALEKLTGGAPLPEPAAVAEPEAASLAAMGYVPALPAPTPVEAAAAEVVPEPLPDPKDRVAVYNKYWQASELAEDGQAQAAVMAYRDALSGDPRLAAAWQRLATLLIEGGRVKEAADALVTLVKLSPEPSWVTVAEQRLEPLVAGPATVDRYLLAAAVWNALGEKARAADVRTTARKALGEATVRKAEAAFKK